MQNVCLLAKKAVDQKIIFYFFQKNICEDGLTVGTGGAAEPGPW